MSDEEGGASRSNAVLMGLGVITVLALVGSAWGVDIDSPAEEPIAKEAPPSPVDFDSEIRPLLARRCFLCHGFDPSSREAGLRLDVRDAAIAPRGWKLPAITPGSRAGSLAYLKITETGGKRMPPDDREALTRAEIERFGQWIDEGALYTEPWAWRPVRDPEPPAVSDGRFADDPIDAFVLARLSEAGLTPAPESSRASWLRRVTFDLIGLPPTPAELDAFVADSATIAHERVVDRLLASPHFGERWGRHWLDLMRYAETHGHEFDYAIPDAWRYRDYVIDAFNADVPYDDFVREHLAGDLIEDPRIDPDLGTNASILGTGFWGLSQGTHAPVDVRQDQADRTDNQIDVLSKTFLGITVSCARCHDHKFDPILTADYYAMAGFLRSSRRARVHLDPRGEIREAARVIEAAVRGLEPLAKSRLELAKRRPWAQAARRGAALLAETLAANEAARKPDRLLFDFEEGDFAGWQVTGDAFGSRPHRLDELVLDQAIGVHGGAVANSHDRRPGSVSEADRRTGTLSSSPFVIDRPKLLFQIGGGSHPAETCVNLRVGGEVVRTETGRDTTAMHAVDWDVAELQGAMATLEVVDRHSAGWGHIAADHFRLADSPPARQPTPEVVVAEARRLHLLAEEFGPLLRAIEGVDRLPAETAPPTLGPDDVLFADFDAPDAFADWFSEGAAFGAVPEALGRIVWDGNRGTVVDAGSAHSGILGGEFQGSLRSPSFSIEHDSIHLRVRGSGQVRVIIDDYYLDTENALLFGGMAQSFDVDHWHHRRHDVSRYRGHRAYLEWNDDSDGTLEIDEVWFSNSDRAPPPRARNILPEAGVSTEEWLADPSIVRWALESGVPLLGVDGTPRPEDSPSDLIRQMRKKVPDPIRAVAFVDGSPHDEHVFVRGAHTQIGALAPRRLVMSLLPEQDPITEGSGRLELAERILSGDNPLPYRVMANRIWLHLLGRGIVTTTDDFGALGMPPTHPDLLDHLATSLRAAPSVKGLIRRIALSATYRQSAREIDPSAAARDPENRLLHRLPPRRLEAEEVRDTMLSVSGRLDRTLGGPSVPMHLTEFLTGRGRPGKSGPLDGDGRRSIYLEIRRNFLSPFLASFDFPVPFSTVGKRSVSNVPAQSLARMNDPFVHQQAQVWAGRILDAGLTSDRARVAQMVREAYGREPLTGELHLLLEFLAESPDRARWKDLAHALFSSQEFIFLESGVE